VLAHEVFRTFGLLVCLFVWLVGCLFLSPIQTSGGRKRRARVAPNKIGVPKDERNGLSLQETW